MSNEHLIEELLEAIEIRLEARLEKLESRINELQRECDNKPDTYDLDRVERNLESTISNLEHKVNYG